MILLTDKKNCCGCSACVQKCPKQCIKMKEDEEGFFYPEIDKLKCIDCSMCEKVCPVINVKRTEQEVVAYVAYANDDDVRMKSSSGGLFTLFAKKILSEHGVIFGAAFDNELMVHHVSVETLEELNRLQGSKYLQSSIENTYQEAEQFLKAGRKVLFTGTACQIAGLKQFLRKKYNLLYTVDVLCHGVPSPKVWKRYLEHSEKYHGGAVTQVFFREKKFGWKAYSMKLKFSNSKVYERIFKKDLFMRLFLSNMCLRPSCHDCKYKSLDRPSDITIGDSWGIEHYMPDMDDDKGTSVVLVHSQQGEQLFDLCKSEMMFKSAEIDKILPPTADSRKSVAMHSRRARFFRKLNAGSSIPELSKMLKPSLLKRVLRKMKIN